MTEWILLLFWVFQKDGAQTGGPVGVRTIAHAYYYHQCGPEGAVQSSNTYFVKLLTLHMVRRDIFTPRLEIT